MRLKALEVPLEILCEGSGALDLVRAVEEAWASCRYDGPEDGELLPIRVRLDPDQGAGEPPGYDLNGSDLATVMDQLSPVITKAAITARAGTMLMFHACALADAATGDTVLLFGPSGAGKTTVARTLGHDLCYLSDETAGVRDDLTVVPYPKPLSILSPGSPVKEQVPASRLGLRPTGPGPFRVRAVVQLRRQPPGGGVEVERVPTVDGITELVAQSSYSALLDRPLHRLAELAHDVGGIARVTYSEAADLQPAVAQLMATRT
jgi:hypothetical protein